MPDWAAIISVLATRGETIATAESCTGGRLASAITAVPGSSVVYRGGVVAYHRDTKVELIGVPRDHISADGEVSARVARDLAVGIRTKLTTDWGIGITGIAGPNGGSPGKPVGTVFAHFIGPATDTPIKLTLAGSREQIMMSTVAAVGNVLQEWLTEGGG